MTAFSDPTIEGFGHYMYDDEGTPARRIYHFDKGIFNGFSNSRQTAALVGAEPNGHYKATDASFVPLIRMSNTAFAPGDRDAHDIIREVDNGYYVVGHRIPSIAESRENFRITAMKVYEINQGEIGEMFRDGGLMSRQPRLLHERRRRRRRLPSVRHPQLRQGPADADQAHVQRRPYDAFTGAPERKIATDAHR